MPAIKVLNSLQGVKWSYDEEKDLFFLSATQIETAAGIELGEGLTIYYDSNRQEVIGFKLLGLRAKLLNRLANEASSIEEDKRLVNAEHRAAHEKADAAAYGKQLFDLGGES